ncbi:expressed unknown protein [Seminavis robusta]|uniref:Uncharacterized protein n=1 Tax=Seminavis robusta TaxID=568900 RepID=A0A9N8DBR2_9STRA|nr:expressed unknown protein [Seminavis robusta]|eukprot:Sro26_g017930.1 n/a (228) ;mRNA; r:162478-163161
MRGELEEGGAFKRRSLINIFEAAELRKELARKRKAYEDPFRDEPRVISIPSRATHSTIQLDRDFRKTNRQGRDGHEAPTEVAMEEIMMEEHVYYASSRSKSRKGKGGKGKSKSASKSRKSKGKGKGRSPVASTSRSKGMMAMSVIVYTPSPTYVPTPQVTIPETDAPTVTPVITDKPTCAPTNGFFPPDVSGFFGQPSGDGSDLQSELDNALNEIQVPSEFVEQCVE